MTEDDGSGRRRDGTRVSDYDYDLPPDRVAQYPAHRRDSSRLMVLEADGSIAHEAFPDVVGLMREGDLLVVNESRVFPARLVGRKPTGARAEVLLVRPLRDSDREASVPTSGSVGLWEALVRPGGKLKPGRRVVVAEGFEVEIVDTAPSGSRIVRLHCEGDVDAAIQRHGHVPLPPYIGRPEEPIDRERYQTVYARESGSVAAPTAGLHFTESLLERLERGGVERVAVTLHVGVGTFRPVEVDDPALHPMHEERYVVSEQVVEAVDRTRQRGGRVWAVGTTAVRTLEAAADADGRLRAGSGETRLFIRPPYDFRVVDGLITNFHLPRSTLLMLVAALVGYDETLAAYQEAVRAGYRFYSYGDAMAIVPRAASDRSRIGEEPSRAGITPS